MATTLLGQERTGQGTLSTRDNDIEYRESYTYTVVSDTANESIFNVLTTPGLPVVMEVYGLLQCKEKTAAMDEGSAFIWRVRAEFSSAIEGQTTGNNPDPTTWVPIWTGNVDTYEEVLFEDKSTPAKKYVNSAKCKFPEPLVIRRPIIVYDFYQFESAGLSDYTIGQRTDKVNDATFRSFPATTLKLTVRSFTKGYFYGYPATRIEYSAAYKPAKWTSRPLDMGYEYLLDGKRIVSDYLVSLNSNGTKKADDATPVNNVEFFPHEEVNFSGFLR